MRGTELLRLVWLNINQNKFKSIMTSIGIVVGAATIMLVIGIGQGGQMDIAEQFAELNAGEINVSYEYEEEEVVSGGGGGIFGAMGNFFGGMMGGFSFGGGSSGGGMPSGGFPFGGGNSEGRPGGDNSGGGFSFPGGSRGNNPFSGGNSEGRPGNSGDNGFSFSGGDMPDFAGGDFNFDGNNPFGDDSFNNEDETEGETETENESEMASEVLEERLNQRLVTLSQKDVDDIELAVSNITGVTISYTSQASIEGGKLLSERTYTIAGSKEAFEDVSRLQMEEGNFINEAQDNAKSKICVLGSTIAKEVFGSAADAIDQTLYIDGRTYTVYGVMKASGTIAGGITLDSTIFIPYETGLKYITGNDISPKITVVAENVDVLQEVIAGVKEVLQKNYTDISFTFEDSGSKMKAAESSNRILTMLLSAMAAIVFVVGGIGIMNVLFVSVKERTNEIGILKAIGTAQGSILMEFLLESAAISFMGGVLGVIGGFAVSPIVKYFNVRVEITVAACLISLGFAVLTGTIFGFYPAWKASRLEPVEALNAE